MYSEAPAKAPYLDWTLDRWKIGVILALFIGLMLASVAAPATEESVILPTETLLPPANQVVQRSSTGILGNKDCSSWPIRRKHRWCGDGRNARASRAAKTTPTAKRTKTTASII